MSIQIPGGRNQLEQFRALGNFRLPAHRLNNRSETELDVKNGNILSTRYEYQERINERSPVTRKYVGMTVSHNGFPVVFEIKNSNVNSGFVEKIKGGKRQTRVQRRTNKSNKMTRRKKYYK